LLDFAAFAAPHALPPLAARLTFDQTSTTSAPRTLSPTCRGRAVFGERSRGHVELPDQPELYGTPDTRERDAYAQLLAREPWHWFATLTFKPKHQSNSGGMHPEKADKAFRYWISHINEYLYGVNHRRKAHGGVVWARGQEFHQSGRVHFHAVLAAPDRDLNASASRYQWHEFWYREFGRNQIEQPRSQDDVLSYVSKYVTKDGEVDFSQNFGTARPPRLFDAEPVARPAFLAPAADQEDDVGTSARPPARVGLSLTLPVRPQLALLNQTHRPPERPDL
jgi:hypothetical protein